jgi:hypothetical protein
VIGLGADIPPSLPFPGLTAEQCQRLVSLLASKREGGYESEPTLPGEPYGEAESPVGWTSILVDRLGEATSEGESLISTSTTKSANTVAMDTQDKP